MNNRTFNEFNQNYTNEDMNMINKSVFVPVFSTSLIIVMFIGVIGNLLVIYVVLNYGRLKTVTNTYLLHLALSDLVFLSGIPFVVSSLLTRAWIFGAFFCKLFFLTQGVNQYTSNIILALLSFDRYLAVCHSSRSAHWRSHFNPNMLLILSWFLSFILMLPIIIFTKLQSDSTNSIVNCQIDMPTENSRLFQYIFIAYTSIITFILPIGFMIYFYIRIVTELKRKVSQQHKRSRSSARTRRKVSILVLTVIGVHIFCGAPYWIIQMLVTIELLPQHSQVLMPVSMIVQLLLFVNSSTNPILYAFLSKVFRSSFKNVFYCCVTTNQTQYLNNKNENRRSHLSTTPKMNRPTNKNKITLSLKDLEKKQTQSNLILSNRQSNGRLSIDENRPAYRVAASLNLSQTSASSEF